MLKFFGHCIDSFFKCHREEAIIIRRVIENDAFHDERIESLKMPAADMVRALMKFPG